ITDLDGDFTINASPNATLVISYIGYSTQEVKISNKKFFQIKLSEDSEIIDEVVVVGYGTQKKGEITSAVTSMKAADFNKVPAVNPMQLIEGRVAGLTVNRTSNDPNENVNVQLRGASSLKGDNQPLVIIDGVPGSMSTLNAIAPEDIEAIDVLKDGSAASIYGTRGNNGVIIVSTKSPEAGRYQVEYSAYIMHEGIYKKPDILSAQEFIDYGKKTDNKLIKDYEGRDKAYDLLLNNDNMSQAHNISVSGGSKISNYRASISYKNNEGMAIHTNRENYNGSFAINHKALDEKLSLSFNLSNSYIDADFMPDHGAFYEAIRRNPTIPVYKNDGSFYEDYGGYEDWNPVARSEQQEKQVEYKNLLANFQATYIIISDLKTSALMALEKNDEQENSYVSKEAYTSIKSGENGIANKSYEKWTNQTFEWTTTYNHTFENVHNVKGLLGYSYQDFDYQMMGMENKNFLTDVFKTNNMEAGSYLKDGKAGMSSKRTKSSLIAYFARANYNYDGKYMASLSIRHEGSSKFGTNNKWANFPSASVGWMISREGFMESIPAINTMKLRVGYGVTGSLPIDPYMSLIKYGTGAGGYNPYSGEWLTASYGPDNNPNPNLKWEKSKSLNFGVDFGLFENRISGSIDIYKRTTDDLIGSYTAQQPALIYDSILTNVGSMENKGLELTLNAIIVKLKEFNYKAALTFTYEKNELTSLSNDQYKSSYEDRYSLPSPGNIGYAQRLQEGHPVGSFYGYICDGIDSEGDYILRDLDNKEGLSDGDRTFIGNGLPKVKVGLQNNFTYKNFDLSFFLRGMFDYDILNEGAIYFGTTTSIDKSANNVFKYALDTKIKQDPRFSTYFLEKGDFLKIDNVTLGYTFNLAKNKYLRNIRLYGNVTNLVTFTSYRGLTPDINVTGLEAGIDKRGVYPITRTFTFGINIGF
ncbi:MAG: TonB-dependent receptor, partial [Clostridia bacterium]